MNQNNNTIYVYTGTDINGNIRNLAAAHNALLQEVNHKTFPEDAMVLIDRGAMNAFIEDASDSRRLAALADKRRLVYLTEMGKPLHMTEGIFLYVAHVLDKSDLAGIMTALCPRQIKDDWSFIMRDAYLIHGAPLDRAATYNDYEGIQRSYREHADNCGACEQVANGIATIKALPARLQPQMEKALAEHERMHREEEPIEEVGKMLDNFMKDFLRVHAGDKGDIESLMKKIKDVFSGKGGLGDFNFDGAIVMEVSDLNSSPFGTRKRGGVGMFGHTYDELFANARRANRGFGSDTRREGAAPAGSRG